MDQIPLWQWTAHDAHPHQRNAWWVVAFLAVIGGIVIWSLVNKDWYVALTFVVVVGYYFYAHRTGTTRHTIKGFDEGLLIGDQFLPWDAVGGFWMTHTVSAQILHLRLAETPDREINLQMGDLPPDWFRERLTELGLTELDVTESWIDEMLRHMRL